MLEAETSFRCPLPWWDQRETHIVLRSGEEGLGEWESHTRLVARDYIEAVGEPLPERIVGVWFIVNEFGGDARAAAQFANVEIRASDSAIQIFD